MNKLTHIPTAAGSLWLRWAAGLACTVALAGCAALDAAGSPEEAVTKRSSDYWKARMAGDVAKTYAFTSPGYRAVNDQEKYRLSYGVIPALQGGDVVSVTCEPARCELRKSFTTSTPAMMGARIPISINEVWIKEEGRWWLFIQ